MDKELPKGYGSSSGRKPGVVWGLKVIRNKVVCFLILVVAMYGALNLVETKFDKKLEARDVLICNDIKQLNDTRVFAVKQRLHCDR